jgi:hypothetical protein
MLKRAEKAATQGTACFSKKAAPVSWARSAHSKAAAMIALGSLSPPPPPPPARSSSGTFETQCKAASPRPRAAAPCTSKAAAAAPWVPSSSAVGASKAAAAAAPWDPSSSAVGASKAAAAAAPWVPSSSAVGATRAVVHDPSNSPEYDPFDEAASSESMSEMSVQTAPSNHDYESKFLQCTEIRYSDRMAKLVFKKSIYAEALTSVMADRLPFSLFGAQLSRIERDPVCSCTVYMMWSSDVSNLTQVVLMDFFTQLWTESETL